MKFQIKSDHNNISGSKEQGPIHLRVRKTELSQCFIERDQQGYQAEENED